uniref:PDZ domain containing 1 n=1 Tax=Apteryx owenii TaxID=8824 RepID=A0A8B9NXP4_APTOW
MTSALQPRECKVTKKPQKSYGFYLRIEKDTAGHLIRNVEKDSPADKAGLKDNDTLVAVNGEQVEALDHEQVVEKIKQSEEKLTLLVVDKETDTMYKLVRKLQDPSPAKMEERVELHTGQKVNKPRICKMVKGPSGFGFNLNMIKNKPGPFISEVQNSGPADTAGLKDNDFLVEVNGVNVMNEPYEKVVTRVQDSGDELTLLVCSKDAYEYFQHQKTHITASTADPSYNAFAPPAHTENPPAEPERTSPDTYPKDQCTKTLLSVRVYAHKYVYT